MIGKKIAICGLVGHSDDLLKKYKDVIMGKNEGAQVDVISRDILSEDEIIEKLQGYDILMSGFQHMTEKSYAATNLTAYCACSIGFEYTNPAAATEHGVLVTHNPEYCLDEVAEHAIALILNCARGLYKMVPYVKEGNWGFHYLKPLNRFKDSTVGLYGFGRIPRLVASKLSGFGARVITSDPYINKEQAAAGGAELVDFEYLIANSDFLSIHAPLTKETKGIFNASVFNKMRKNAFIINTARGPVINQQDFYAALTNGTIRGAALDVMDNEPPQETDRKLIDLPNVVVTGHSAFYSDDSMNLQIELTAETIRQVLNKEKPKNIVNREVIEKIDWITD